MWFRLVGVVQVCCQPGGCGSGFVVSLVSVVWVCCTPGEYGLRLTIVSITYRTFSMSTLWSGVDAVETQEVSAAKISLTCMMDVFFFNFSCCSALQLLNAACFAVPMVVID